MVNGQRHREPVLPSITLVMNQNRPSKSRYASWYKPRVDTIPETGTTFESFRDDWALSRIDRRLDDSHAVTSVNRSLKTRASCPGIRSVRYSGSSKVDERNGWTRQPFSSTSCVAGHMHITHNANPETEAMTSRPSPGPSTSADANKHDGVHEVDASTSTPITRTLPVSVPNSILALTPASTPQQASTSSLLPPAAILRPSDDASSEISELVLEEAMSGGASTDEPCESDDDLRTHMGGLRLSPDGKAVDAASKRESQRPLPSSVTGSPGSPARSTPRLPKRSSRDSDIRALPPALTDLRPFLCSSPLALHRSKSMSLDSEADLDTPPHTPTPSISGSVKKPRAPIHLLQPYDDKSFTVEVQYVQAKKGKMGGAFAAIRKALNFNTKTRETKTVNKAINKIVLPH